MPSPAATTAATEPSSGTPSLPRGTKEQPRIQGHVGVLPETLLLRPVRSVKSGREGLHELCLTPRMGRMVRGVPIHSSELCAFFSGPISGPSTFVPAMGDPHRRYPLEIHLSYPLGHIPVWGLGLGCGGDVCRAWVVPKIRPDVDVGGFDRCTAESFPRTVWYVMFDVARSLDFFKFRKAWMFENMGGFGNDRSAW